MSRLPWSSERLGIVLAILAALGFSFKAIFVKLAYLVSPAAPVDAVTLLSLRMTPAMAPEAPMLPVLR